MWRQVTAVPLSVCSVAGLPVGRAIADVETARLVVGRVGARGDLAETAPDPGIHASQSYLKAAEAPRSSTAIATTR